MTVKQKVKRKILKKFLFLLLAAALLCGIFFYYQTKIKVATMGILAIPVFTVVYVIIVIKSKFFKLLSDKDWEGEITAVNVKIAAEPITFGVAVARTPPKMIPYTVIDVKRDDQKNVTLTIMSSKMALCNFKTGGRIKHQKGTLYPILLDPPNPDNHFCPICGRVCDTESCPDCRVDFDK